MSQTKPLPPEFEALSKFLLLYINATPKLASLLYDLDLLPEQLEEGSRNWMKMLLIAEAWKNRD